MTLRKNFGRFKEPRGLIKILQFLFAILAFSTTAGYHSEFRVSISGICHNNTSRNGTHDELVKFGYPFDDADYYIEGDESGCFESDHLQHKLGSDYKSESQFFVFVGVVSFLYCVVAAVYYVSFEDPEKYGPGGTGTSIKSFAVLDFLTTMVLALFWFAGSTAWAVGLHSLKDKTDADKYTKTASECRDSGATCDVLKEASYVGLTISVLFGFLNCFLWCGNVWFVYKETPWHKESPATTSTEKPSGEIPRQQVPNEESIN